MEYPNVVPRREMMRLFGDSAVRLAGEFLKADGKEKTHYGPVICIKTSGAMLDKVIQENERICRELCSNRGIKSVSKIEMISPCDTIASSFGEDYGQFKITETC